MMFKQFLKRSPLKRTFFFLGSDAILLALAFYLSFYIRFEGEIPEIHLMQFFVYLPAFAGLKIIAFYLFQIHRFTWSYVGLYELLKIFKILTICSLILSSLILFLAYEESFKGFPRSVFLIDYTLSLILVGGFMISKRVYLHGTKISLTEQKRTLIIGAGNAGEQIVRDMKRTKDSPYLPVAFVDDDPSKEKVLIHGIKVMGDRKDIPEIIKNLEIEMAVIAMPSIPSKEIRDIVSYLHKAGVSEIRIIPGTKEIMSRNISILDIKKIDLKDLLSREPIQIEYSQVRKSLEGKRVLITGAGGSIGSELGRQIAQFKPSLLALLDFDETELFYITQELKEDHPGLEVLSVLGDILNGEKMAAVYREIAPQVVFHAAAYKHVPMIEDFPEEAIRINILGTKILAELSQKSGVEKFVFVSTDKAVNPTSVMGVSKRVAEMVIMDMNHREKTQFMAVRFGNVLGSRGSVIPIFQEQIRRGGPVTVTHPEMKRYFITIPEAVLLVLQAGSMGEGGEVFVLDMGEQVNIYDVACELIRLSGFEPEKDIPIVFTGIRPGEKLFEEVLNAEEGVEGTAHPKIFKAKFGKSLTEGYLNERIERLEGFAKIQDTRSIVQTFHELIPYYQPNRNEVDEEG
ncbi:MAG: polysaccharide biosynthesis protein [Deltaproteobacteria bacterium]|nr:polysaccharide biosynthesis protein [Deltaproteobacteria bacterium]